MKVILLENIKKLGTTGEQVQVKAGFGRNYLIPNNKALPATPANLKQFESRRAEYESAAAKALADAQQRQQALVDVKVVLQVKAGEAGKLFGAVTTRDIAEAITAAGVAVSKAEVMLLSGPIRTVGPHTIKLRLHPEVEHNIEIDVVAQA